MQGVSYHGPLLFEESCGVGHGHVFYAEASKFGSVKIHTPCLEPQKTGR